MRRMYAVIPAYEPDEKMLALLPKLAESGMRLLIVDDGSGPKYDAIFAKAKDYGEVIRYVPNAGKGHAMKTAFRRIAEEEKDGGTFGVVVVDCDGQHKVSDALMLCAEAEKHPGALLLGSRRQSKDSPWKSRFGNAVTRFVFRVSSGVRVYDTQTGLRAFSGDLLDFMLKVPGERYEYEMNMLMLCAREKIPMIECEIETIYMEDNAGTHFDPIRDSARIYKEILKFSAASFAGFLVDYALYSLLLILLGKGGQLAANILARIVSATVNFSLNRSMVFATSEPLVKSAAKYALLAVCVLAANSAILLLLTQVCGMNPFAAKIATELVLFVLNYIAQRTLVFRSSDFLS